MKATFTFDQIAHLARLAQQKGVASGDQLQDHIDAGILSDAFEIPDPKKITKEARDAARRAYGLNPLQPPLLEPIGTINMPATTHPLVVRDEFAVGKNGISYVGENVKQWFHPKVEAPTPAVMLRRAKLTRDALDDEIRKEIGAEREESTMGQVLYLIRRQKNGRAGVLLNNGHANIFYVRDATGTLQVVRVGWHGDGWYVVAGSVTGPGRWYGGFRVFSRNS